MSETDKSEDKRRVSGSELSGLVRFDLIENEENRQVAAFARWLYSPTFSEVKKSNKKDLIDYVCALHKDHADLMAEKERWRNMWLKLSDANAGLLDALNEYSKLESYQLPDDL